MATISYRGPYQWRAKIRRIGYPIQSKTLLSKADAEAWVREVEGQMDRGIFVDTSALNKITVFDIIDRYGREITPTKKGGSKEQSKIRTLKKSHIAGLTLSRIQPVDIVEYRKVRIKEVAPATVAKEMNLLSNIFNVARSEWGLRGLLNPAEGVRRPTPPKERDRRLEPGDEMERIVEETQSPVLKILIPLAVETAMRRSEMVNIKVRDINFTDRTIILRNTKNGETRTVPLSSRAISVLKEHTNPTIDGDLFDITPDAATQAFKRALIRARRRYEQECKESGATPNPRFLVDLRLHDMRHEATSRLFENTDLRDIEIMSITGHKDSRQLKRYTHLRAKDIAKRLG